MNIQVKSQATIFHGEESSVEVIDIGSNCFSVTVWKLFRGKEHLIEKRDILGFLPTMAYVYDVCD